MANTAAAVMTRAIGEIGYSRWDDPQPGTKYGRWYAELVGSSYYGESGVPFCAMGASWSFYLESASCAGLPGAYCPTMLAEGIRQGKRVSTGSGKYGDVVYFDWNGDGVSDHVGLVEGNTGSYLQTVEFNTGNGVVARRTRAYSTVIGVVRPDYGAAAAPAPSEDIEKLARAVINGDYGTGEARKQALGDRYDEVQRRVNEILQGSSSPSAPSSPSVDTSVPAGTYKIVVGSLNVRTAASTNSTSVAAYSRGQTVILDGWGMESGGYIWGRYIGASSGQYRYIAVRTTGGDTYAQKIA